MYIIIKHRFNTIFQTRQFLDYRYIYDHVSYLHEKLIQKNSFDIKQTFLASTYFMRCLQPS